MKPLSTLLLLAASALPLSRCLDSEKDHARKPKRIAMDVAADGNAHMIDIDSLSPDSYSGDDVFSQEHSSQRNVSGVEIVRRQESHERTHDSAIHSPASALVDRTQDDDDTLVLPESDHEKCDLCDAEDAQCEEKILQPEATLMECSETKSGDNHLFSVSILAASGGTDTQFTVRMFLDSNSNNTWPTKTCDSRDARVPCESATTCYKDVDRVLKGSEGEIVCTNFTCASSVDACYLKYSIIFTEVEKRKVGPVEFNDQEVKTATVWAFYAGAVVVELLICCVCIAVCKNRILQGKKKEPLGEHPPGWGEEHFGEEAESWDHSYYAPPPTW